MADEATTGAKVDDDNPHWRLQRISRDESFYRSADASGRAKITAMGKIWNRVTNRSEQSLTSSLPSEADEVAPELSHPSESALPPSHRRALLDARWEGTPGYREMVVRHTWVGSVSVLLLLLCISAVFLGIREVFDISLSSTVGILSFFGSYIGFIYISYDRIRHRRQFMAIAALDIADQLQERERDLAESGEPLSLAALWSVTQERIEYYHQIVTTQSEVSFRNGAITSYLGLGLLLALAVVAIFTSANLATSITIGVLGAVGAALSGYLGATFIKLHTESSAQLREFFSQPVEFSRLLGAERLIESLPEAERAESVQVVIRAMMRAD